MPYRLPPRRSAIGAHDLARVRLGLLLLAGLAGVKSLLAGAQLVAMQAASALRPYTQTEWMDNPLFRLRLVEVVAWPILAVGTAYGTVVFAWGLRETPAHRPARVAAWAHGIAAVVNVAGLAAWSIGGLRAAATVPLSVLLTIPLATVGLASLLLAAWRLGRALRAPSTGWMHLAISASTLGEALLWRWGPRAVRSVAMGPVAFYVALGMVSSVLFALGICVPLRRWTRSRELHIAPASEREVPELFALSRALRPFAAALGAKVALGAVAAAAMALAAVYPPPLLDLPSVRVFFTAADGLVSAALLASLLPLRPRPPEVSGWLGVWCGLLLLGVGALATASDSPSGPPYGLGVLLGPLSALAWLVAADRLGQALAAALRHMRVPVGDAFLPPLRRVALSLSLLTVLFVWNPESLQALHACLAGCAVIVAATGLPTLLRATLLAEARVDVALDREAAAIAREPVEVGTT